MVVELVEFVVPGAGTGTTELLEFVVPESVAVAVAVAVAGPGPMGQRNY